MKFRLLVKNLHYMSFPGSGLATYRSLLMTNCAERLSCGYSVTTLQSHSDALRSVVLGLIVSRHLDKLSGGLTEVSFYQYIQVSLSLSFVVISSCNNPSSFLLLLPSSLLRILLFFVLSFVPNFFLVPSPFSP